VACGQLPRCNLSGFSALFHSLLKTLVAKQKEIPHVAPVTRYTRRGMFAFNDLKPYIGIGIAIAKKIGFFACNRSARRCNCSNSKVAAPVATDPKIYDGVPV